jgi:arylsulfatase A-like enzyme
LQEGAYRRDETPQLPAHYHRPASRRSSWLHGNTVVKTPHIDAIAARGTRFEQFYVATPICMPNRATLMTGRMPSLHGSRHNGIPLSLDATTFVQALAAVGWKPV